MANATLHSGKAKGNSGCQVCIIGPNIDRTSTQYKMPFVSADAVISPEVTDKFLLGCQPFHHLVNIFTEHIAPDFVQQSKSLVARVAELQQDNWECLANNKCYFFSQAALFNSTPGNPHKDKESSWSGFDAIGVFGDYEGGSLEFPELQCSFPSRPGDLIFIRGAGLLHQSKGWSGKGRMVLTMFANRRIFFKENINRPSDLHPVYGQDHKRFRSLHPYEHTL